MKSVSFSVVHRSFQVALSCGPTVGKFCWSDASSSASDSIWVVVSVEEVRPLLDCSHRDSSCCFLNLLVLGEAKLKRPNIADGVQTLRRFRLYNLLGLFTTPVFIQINL